LFFNDTATTEIYTLSLHDALPICDFYTTVLEHLLLGKPLYIHAEEVRRQIAVIKKCHELNPLDKFC